MASLQELDSRVQETTNSIGELNIKDINSHHNTESDDDVDENITIISELTTPDPNNFSIKHPLQNRWTLWYDNPQGKTNQNVWAEQLKKVVTFDTVEDFWRIFNNIRPASKLAQGANYHLFKEGVEPKWEDAENKQGGKWTVTCKSGSKDTLDKWWLWTVLACIGENFDDENEVCGCVVSIRKGQDRLSLWTKTWAKEDTQRRIGAQMKRTLEIADTVTIGYSVHSDALKRNSSFNNRPKYEI